MWSSRRSDLYERRNRSGLCWGTISYDEVFNHSHVTEFCLFYRGTGIAETGPQTGPCKITVWTMTAHKRREQISTLERTPQKRSEP